MRVKQQVISFWLVLGLLAFFIGCILYSVFREYITEGMDASGNSAPIDNEGPGTTITNALLNNSAYIYYPYVINNDVKTPNCAYYINDVILQAVEIPACIKTYKNLAYTIGPTRTTNEYSTSVSSLAIYKLYNSTLSTNAYKKQALQKKYGQLFDPATLTPTKQPGSKAAPPSADVTREYIQSTARTVFAYENKLFYFVQVALTGVLPANTSKTAFSDYFSSRIYTHRNSKSQLDTIQGFMEKLFGQLVSHENLVIQFQANPNIYSTRDDALYIMNTTAETLSAINLPITITTDVHSGKNGIAYIFEKDKAADANIMDVDVLTLFSMLYVLFQIYPLTTGQVSTYLQIPLPEFSDVFSKYMTKKYPRFTATSIVSFAAVNIPDFTGW